MTSDYKPEKDMSIILQQLKEIAEAVMYAASEGTLESVLQRIAEVSRKVVNARYAALGVPDHNESLQYFKTDGMSQAEIDLIDHLPRGEGLLGVIMNERQILRLETMQKHPNSVGFPENHPQMTSLLGVPIQVGDQLFGMLYLCDRLDGLPFDDEDQWLIESLAGYAALAIAGVQISEQNSRITLLEERERVGMELHDGIIQSLYAIGIQLQLMRLDQKFSNETMGNAIRDLDKVIEDIREYILDLKVANYRKQTIIQCLEDEVQRMNIPNTLAINIDAPSTRPAMSDHVLEAVCQIVHEAVSNVVRHANASEVNINAKQENGKLHLIIIDNGQGFDLSKLDTHNGLGLRNIRQRINMHNGKVVISTEAHKGTTLNISVPLMP